MYANDEDVSPKRQCKSHGVTKCDADPDHLFRVRCSRCEYFRDFDPSGAGAAKYLYYRRRTRAARGLLSVGAPLDGPSAAYLCQAAAECGIVSNTSQPHVTFVEGLVPDVDHTASIGKLRSALFRDPKLTVVSVHRVPRRDNATDLILADVILSPGADMAATELSDGRVCHLPQFPFHVALGACPKARGGSKWAAARAEGRLKGVALAFDATRVRVLPPPEGSKKLLQQKHGHGPHHSHHQSRSPVRHHHQHGRSPQHHGHHGHGHHHGHHHAHAQSQPHSPPHAHYHHHHVNPQQHHHHYQQQQQYYQSSPPQHHQWGGHVPPLQIQVQASAPSQTHARQHAFAVSPAPSFGYSSDQGSSDDADAASTSGSSSTSEEAGVQFPGLVVDLNFLDDSANVANITDALAAENKDKTKSIAPPHAPANNVGVPPTLTSIWAQA
uniref:Uncharacterized protein n=1 Tax=Odontella aurita TaxID=265563 RepID=A0A7S4K7W5_9STRA|mmetsp:Transcript_63491/g.187463  ORF Transcript_63491/g.187463 Transcript_63491/m.187463 type:complete len:440 (+) Transcript_63491:175-1494(+)